ncbi:MAG: hypothetical protein II228_00500, partial [Alistipes sp.]|nr:hypothetical protein [Alistipes sp.]
LDRRVFTLDEGAHHFAVRLPGVKAEAELMPGCYLVTKQGFERVGDVEYNPTADRIFEARRDYPTLLFTRGGFFSPSFDARPSKEGNLRLYAENLEERAEYWFPADISAQHYIGDRLTAGKTPRALQIRVRALTPSTTSMRLLLNEDDFGSWGATVALSELWQTLEVPVSAFRPDRTPQLPQDWPGISPYYRPDFGGTATEIDWPAVENLFFALRGEEFADKGAGAKGIEVEWVKVIYE